MRLYGFFILLCLLGCNLISCRHNPKVPLFHNWPVISKYDSEHTGEIKIPIGGIGTGTISLTGQGEIADVRFFNCTADNSSNSQINIAPPIFAIYARPDGKDPSVRKLSGTTSDNYIKDNRMPLPENNLTGFEDAVFEGAYPFSAVRLRDRKMPVEVNIKTFNPLIPGETGPSGLPIAVLIYEVKNITNSMVEVSVCGALSNLNETRTDGMPADENAPLNDSLQQYNRNSYLEFRDVQGIYMIMDNMVPDDPSRATIALTTAMADSVSYITSVNGKSTEEGFSAIWDDFSRDGVLNVRPDSPASLPVAALAISQFLNPGETRYFRFFITWHSWSRGINARNSFYAADYTDAWDAAKKITTYLPDFEDHGMRFIKSLMENDLPAPLIEAAARSLSGLNSTKIYRDEEGNMSVRPYDTLNTNSASEFSSWRYDFAYPFLFGKLSKTMNSTVLKQSGLSSESTLSAVMKLYNDWQLSADSSLLAENWPTFKKALETCMAVIDRDSDGVCDLSVNSAGESGGSFDFFGLQFYYLGALKASVKMAESLSDTTFASKHSAFLEKGTLHTNDSIKSVPSGSLQAGSFAGLALARICGLGNLTDSDAIRRHLRKVYSDNMQKSRNSETTDRCSDGQKYAAASLCLFEGFTEEGIGWITQITKMQDGRSGNPYYQAEDKCSWAMSTAAWAVIIAYTQFSYSRVTATMHFSSRPGTYFWSDGYAWGVVRISESQGKITNAEVQVHSGELRLRKFVLNGFGERVLSIDEPVLIKSGEAFPFAVVR